VPPEHVPEVLFVIVNAAPHAGTFNVVRKPFPHIDKMFRDEFRDIS